MTDLALKFWKARGIWLRFLFCWALGLTFQFFDEAKNYDLRFKMRGSQEVSKDIVLINFDLNDLNGWRGADPDILRKQKEVSPSTDSAFWNPSTWNYLLTTVLQQNPRTIGVNFFFSDQLKKPEASQHALTDPRVIWAAQLDSEGRPALPLLSTAYGYNVALVDLREDEDRILRRFYVSSAPIPHMGLKLAESPGVVTPPDMSGGNRLINFRGQADIFPSISALAVLEGRVPPSFFRDKIVLIGSHNFAGELYQTPLGRMSRNEVLAQVVDDAVDQRWIRRPSGWWVAGYLMVILLLAVLILTTYPQAVALVFLLWLGAGSIALSLWVFDSFNFWLPAFSPLALILVTYMIFLGYQLAISENQTWRLEQEKTILSELEQLRNNFVSLISHDLKTPIAKIQAICDRLLADHGATAEIREGLVSVRQESSELHRYIQSILQLSRLEASQVRVRREATDLNEIVETVIKQLAPITRDRNQQIEAKLEPLFSIEADTVLVQEVVLNLIENASKYTPTGGHIKVETEEVDDKVIFSVEDNGPGIPQEDQQHLFEKFFRGKAQKSQIKGTGLGLFLVKYFIELHGGEVFLESELGKGTRVRFSLPLQA